MKKASLLTVGLLAGLAACSRGGSGNDVGNDANVAAQEGVDLNSAISGDELSPIPEAEDDMIANGNRGAHLAGNDLAGNAAAPAPQVQPPPVPIPAPAPPRP